MIPWDGSTVATPRFALATGSFCGSVSESHTSARNRGNPALVQCPALQCPVNGFDRGSPAGTPIGNGGPWRLYNIKGDPAERNELSVKHPEIVEKLLAEWEEYVTEYGVLVKSREK